MRQGPMAPRFACENRGIQLFQGVDEGIQGHQSIDPEEHVVVDRHDGHV